MSEGGCIEIGIEYLRVEEKGGGKERNILGKE